MKTKNTKRYIGEVIGLGTALLMAWGCSGPRAGQQVGTFYGSSAKTGYVGLVPLPTEHWLDDGAEERNKDGRRRWMEEMHRTADGINWREIERQNKLTDMLRRNAIGNGNQALAGGVDGTWSEVGSRNLAGRMHCGYLGSNGQTLYGGSALGGVWKGTLDGDDWEPLGDNLYGTSNELVILPGENEGEPDVIVVFTDGGSIHVSRNEGTTWEVPSGIGSLNWIRGVAVLDDAARTVVFYGRGSSSGGRAAIYASTDYARTFSPRWDFGSSWQGYMWVPRVGAEAANTLYVVHEGRLYRSSNSGFTFGFQGTIDAGASRALLTGSEAGAPRLYAAVDSSGWNLYRSDDVGQAWVFTDPLPDFWATSFCASIHNTDVVIYGGLEAHRSTNGGLTFNIINTWGSYYGNPEFRLHADIFGLHCWPDPDNANEEIWYISTDGGIYHSLNAGASVQNLSMEGLGISQYYSTLTDRNDSTLLVAGSQDQGYQRGFVQSPDANGPSTPMTQLISGDYGHMTSTDGTHNLVYCTYPGFVLIQEDAQNPILHTTGFPDGSDHSWLPPVEAHPTDPNQFFFCGDRLYRYTRSGNSWTPLVHSSFDFSTGGNAYLSALEFAPPETNRAYACTNAGRLYYSTNGGDNWTQSGSTGPSQHYFYGNSIAINPNDPMEVAVSGSGYSNPGVVRSTNGGVSFSAEANGLPSTMVYGVTFAANTGDLYAATEAGAYRWDRQSGEWENIMGNMAPLTTYWSVESVDDGATIRFGTYGRGIWDYSPAFAIAPKAEDSIFVTCNVDADCEGVATCEGGTCYVPKNRYISIAPADGNSGVQTARRVSLDSNDNGVFDAGVDRTLGWMGQPIEVEVSGPEGSPKWLARLDAAPRYADWDEDANGDSIHLGDCSISPGHRYFVQSIGLGSDLADEGEYSLAISLPTAVAWGDTVGSAGPWSPPDGVVNFVDVQAVLFGFQNIQLTTKVWLDLEGTGDPSNVPDFSVINFVDILRAVQGFQAQGYPYEDPCECLGLGPC